MKKYNKIDLFRFICSCFVVFIHMGIENTSPIASAFIVCFCRQAVPYFFIVSGFFFNEKYQLAKDKANFTKSYTLKLLKYYFIWIFLQIPMLLGDYIPLYKDRSPVYLVAVLLRRIFIAGTAPFWYLLALAETGLIAGILLKRKKNVLYCIAIIGWFAGYLYTQNIPALSIYNNAVYSIFSWENNFLMVGLPFFSIGVYINTHKDDIQISSRYALITLLFSYIMTVLKFYFVRTQNMSFLDYLPVHIIQPISMFIYAITDNRCVSSASISRNMRDYSSVIYCLHTFVLIYMFGNIIPRTYNTLLDFITTITICIIIGFIAKKLKNKQLYQLLTIR